MTSNLITMDGAWRHVPLIVPSRLHFHPDKRKYRGLLCAHSTIVLLLCTDLAMDLNLLAKGLNGVGGQVFETAGDQMAEVSQLVGHEGPVWQVTWAHPKFGSVLASCGFDHKVIVWKESQESHWVQV